MRVRGILDGSGSWLTDSISLSEELVYAIRDEMTVRASRARDVAGKIQVDLY
jgi:hypothetical protein